MRKIPLVLVPVVALVVIFAPRQAEAAPTEECRKLAKQFADNSDKLSTQELARLRTCVSVQLEYKLGPVTVGPPEAYAPPKTNRGYVPPAALPPLAK